MSNNKEQELTWVWKGQELINMHEVMDAAIKAMHDGEASEFLDHYIGFAGEECARQNLGYHAADYSSETFYAILDAYNVEHPFFGRTLPTAENAFKMGVALGEKMKAEAEAKAGVL
jgi:hypothetical protein